MKLKTRERYSLRMMMAIAKLSSHENPVGLREVSIHCNVSRKYLENLVGPLRNGALLRAVSGRAGGYTLGRDASDIRVGDIIRAAVGPIEVTECASDPEYCLLSDFCSCRTLWSMINQKINNILDMYTLADMLDDGWPRKMQEEQQKAAASAV